MPVGALDVKFSCSQAQLKGEDVIVVPQHKKTTSYFKNFVLFAVCDGHGGANASVYVGRRIEQVIYENIDVNVLESALKQGISFVAESLRDALHSAFLQLDREFSEQFDLGDGTTLTVVLIYGRLLTVANIGDSKAVYILPELGAGEELSDDHRIQDNESERLRMIRAGATISQTKIGNRMLGVLRVQPSGLALSRSIGDEMSKPYVVANPHITQVLLPYDQKSKIVLASDGLWDDLSIEEVAMYSSRKKLVSLPTKLIKKAMQANGGQLGDDISVVAISLKPCVQKQLDVARETISRKLLGIKDVQSVNTKSKFVGCYDLDKCGGNYVDNPFQQQNHYQNGFQDVGWRFPMPVLCVDTFDAPNKLQIQNLMLSRKTSKSPPKSSASSSSLSSLTEENSEFEIQIQDIDEVCEDEENLKVRENGCQPDSCACLTHGSLTISPLKVVRKRVKDIAL